MSFEDRDQRSPSIEPSSRSDRAIGDWHALSEVDRLQAFQSLRSGEAFELFLSLDPADQEALITALPLNERRGWLRLLTPDVAADVIQHTTHEERSRLLSLLENRVRQEVEALLEYEDDVAGGRMNPSYAWVRPDMTVTQALAYLRLHAAERTTSIYYTYVLDHNERLLGVVSFRDLIAAPASRRIDEVMLRDPVTVHEETDQETVARVLQDANLLAVPVVDDDQRIRGIITLDDVIDVVEEEATEDIQKIAGVQALALPYFRTTVGAMLRKRVGWLSLLFVSQTLTATAMGFFQGEIQQAVVLVLFIPLVISSGGNSGGQAATLIIRALALDEVRVGDWRRVMRRELLIGVSLGATLAVLGALRVFGSEAVFGSYGDQFIPLALTIALSLIGVVAWGTLSGAMLPLALRRIGFDPANASAPFVATLSDVTGLLIYFSIARVILLR
jgi:magnesium transporter